MIRMDKPLIILKDYLLMPILATEVRFDEIRNELKNNPTNINLNGLFLMLVSYIESMQKEIVKYYLKYNPEKLSGDSIEVDKAILLQNEDFYLLESIVVNHIDKMPHWKLFKIFYEVLKIRNPSNEYKIQKLKARRNELIHKNLEVNFKRKEISQDFINKLYLENCLDDYGKYLIDIKTYISEVYVNHSKINVIKKLWHFTFETPLCSNFYDYWYVDNEKDIIIGCKYPEIKVGLSSTEKFMLEIWRSQVCGGKIEFLNMASIGRHFQNCLYSFLKLSNDLFPYS